jgi:hypothetical protein
MHPFTPDLTGLTDEELTEKINELYSKMRMLAGNPPVYQQLMSLLDDYKNEQTLRMNKQREELDEKLSKKVDIGKNNNG